MTQIPDEPLPAIRRRLADGMLAHLEAGGDAGYTRGHVDRCLAIVDACLAKLAPGRTVSEPQITGAVREAVLALNALNERCWGTLIEADQREDLCRLLLGAARGAGLGAGGDITEAWREW